jgi:hypothetical protein
MGGMMVEKVGRGWLVEGNRSGKKREKKGMVSQEIVEV